MTPAELRAARATLGLTQGALATKIGVSRRTIQQYEADLRAVPEPIARIVRLALTDPTVLERIAAA